MSGVWTKDRLEQTLKPLAVSYLAAGENLSVVVGVHVDGNRHVLVFSQNQSIEDARVDEDTIFEIGSTTMAFTACLLAEMVQKNQVRLDDPVKKFLPQDMRVPSWKNRDITLLDLVTHSSGLPRIPLNFAETVIDPCNPCANYTVKDLYVFLSGYEVPEAVGSRRAYSNLGMGLLGHVLALAAGADYEHALRERICAPLELMDTTISLTSAQKERLIQGHGLNGQAVGTWEMPALPGAGALRSSTRDLLRFVEANLARDGPLGAVLKRCRTPMRKTGRPPSSVLRYAVAACLTALALAAQWQWSAAAGSGLFFALLIMAGFVAAWHGGFWPGAVTVVLMTIGNGLLWDAAFEWPLPVGAGLLVCWLASAKVRELSKREALGWHRSATGFLATGPKVLWHSGETGGCASFIGLMEERKTAVVVLANSAHPVVALGFRILMVLNQAPST